MTVDRQVQEALAAGVAAVVESHDLFDRVQSSIDDDRRLRDQRTRRVLVLLCLAAAIASITAATIDRREGDPIMDWWILELIWFAAMVATALWLGPFIRRFGKAYAADVFRANPRTGKSFIVLMDVAYYLIFFAYILFTVRFEPDKRLGADRQRQPAAGVHDPLRGHPADRRPAPRPQRPDLAHHGPDLHPEPPPGRRHDRRSGPLSGAS